MRSVKRRRSPPEERQQQEEESVTALMEKLKVSKAKAQEQTTKPTENGDAAHGETTAPEEPTPRPSEENRKRQTTQKLSSAMTNPRHTPTATPTSQVASQATSSSSKSSTSKSSMSSACNGYPSKISQHYWSHSPTSPSTSTPDRLDYVDQVLHYATKEVNRFQNSADLHSQPAQTALLNLLLAPVKAYFSLFTALALPNFVPLLQAQTYPTRRAVAGEVARSLLRNETRITTTENLEGVLQVSHRPD